MPAIPNIPPGFTAARKRQNSPWDRSLLTVVITLGCALAPVFFLDMFRTVTGLLGASGFPDAWTVPAATEGAFVFLYLLGLWLQRKGKPKTWLRWAPYPFAAASLFLNVYAAHGHIAPMVGHASVTIAFFLPVLAAEAAVHSLAVTDDEVKLTAELADARRYALDFVRDQKGIFWRLRVPSLLRRQIARSRPPAAVIAAVREGVTEGGAAKWETTVEEWVTAGLTRGVQMTVKVAAKKREIERQARPSSDRQADRQQTARKPVSRTVRTRAKVTRLLTDKPHLSLAEVAAKAGVSESTVTRIKREMPVPIRAVAK